MTDKRLVWGPDFSTTVSLDAPEGTLHDADVAFKGFDKSTGETTVAVLPHDPITHAAPEVIHAVFIVKGHGIPASAEDAVASVDYPKALAHVSVTGDGGDVVIPKPAGLQPGVEYVGKTVLQYPLPTPTEPTPADPAAPAAPAAS